MQLITSVNEIRSTTHPHCGFWHSFNGKWIIHSGTCTGNNWRAYGVSWYCPRNIAHAVRDFSTRKCSYRAKFWETAVEHEHMWSSTSCTSRFITHSESEACWTCKLLPLHIASPANHHIEIRFGGRHGDSSCICGGIERQIGIIDVLSWWKEICIPILLRVSLYLISVTKLWDMIICLCKCKGQTHHPKVLESKSGCKMSKTFDFCWQVTVKSESNSLISDEILKQNFSKWCRMRHWRSNLCPIRIHLNDDCYAAFIHSSNCITFCTDLVHSVEIIDIAYGMSWKSRRRS